MYKLALAKSVTKDFKKIAHKMHPSIIDAKYLGNFHFILQFNDGLKGKINVRPIIDKYEQAQPLKDEKEVAKFYLDSWPTLAWKCGFDIAPETLYEKCEQNRIS